MKEVKSSRLEAFLENPRRSLWMLALPIMLGMSLHTIYMIVDMIFVGMVSSEALAALAFNMPLVFLALGITFGLGSGITAVIAQFIGARDKQGADSSAEHALLLGLVLAASFTFVGWTWGESILTALGVPPHLLSLAWSYFWVLTGGFLFLVLSVFFRSILTGEGDVKTPVMIQGAGTLLNIALDPLLIFGLDMGVQGAAAATVLSQALTAAVFVYLLFFRKHAYITFSPQDFRFSPEILGNVVRIGAPASFSFLVMAVGGGIYNRLLVEYSTDAVAAYQVGSRLDHIFMLPIIALSAGLVTLVGMFYGARRLDLLRSIITYALTRAVAVAVVIAALFFAFAPHMVSLFSDDERIHALGISYLRVIVFAYPFIAISMPIGRCLQGMSHGIPLLVISTTRVLLVGAPLGWVFVSVLDKPVEWVWFAMALGMVLASVLALLWMRWALRHEEGRVALTEETPLPTAVGMEDA